MADTTPSAPDASIVSKVIDGDIDAYAEIIGRYEPKLQRYVTYLTHNQTVAADVVQDTFIKAYQNLLSFDSKYKFSSWIYRIAHNEAMNAIKKVAHTVDTDIDTLPEFGYDQKINENIDRNIMKEYVHGCVGKLAPKYREVIQLIYFENIKYEEVSDILHTPISTVGVWLSRAKSQLKQICERRE